ncbi:hypothetical protein, partial [Mesorhizobium sp.]
ESARHQRLMPHQNAAAMIDWLLAEEGAARG